jgi:hypothetical protein
MKRPLSLLACILIAFTLVYYRIQYSDIKSPHPLQVTTWDALGYYIYLPAIFIYHDVRELSWFDEIDEKYKLSGGTIYQFGRTKSGYQVFKYLGGVSIIEAPFFFIGHCIARHSDYEADGFSRPYQYSIALGILFYFILSIFLLRSVLLRFFSDISVTVTLILLILATNAINYTAIEPAQSHGPIFPLYVLVIFTTIKWHQNPRIIWASLTGFIIGLATICRPTEAIMFLIPLLWNTQNKETAREKWALVKAHRSHLYYTFLFGFLGVLPQLIYWKYSTGSFVHDVGSAWDFLTPHLRVIIGWEKGWFIYTPVTVFFIVGMFFIRKYPFRKAVIYFCLINIYIIISWRHWRYGGSYSTRALMQSYPVFALAFAAFIQRINKTRWWYIFYLLGVYLIFVNLFQIKQYYNTVIHYDGINRRYYGRVYLRKHPSPLDMSLLDTKEWIRNEKKYVKKIVADTDSSVDLKILPASAQTLAEIDIGDDSFAGSGKKKRLKFELSMFVENGLSGSYLNSELSAGDSLKHNEIRLFSPLSHTGTKNYYAFYVYVPECFHESRLKLYISSANGMEGTLNTIRITSLVKAPGKNANK